MNGLRVALITRRFWPLAGSGETLVADLGQELQRQGVAPCVVTARFDALWPSEAVVREIAVERLPFPRRFGWGMMRYMIALSRWLRRNRPDIDLVYVARLSLEAHAATGAFAGSGIPVVLRAEADETWEEARTHQRRLAHRILHRCQSAAAVVTSSEIARKRLLDAGFLPQRVHLIPDGVPPGHPRTPDSQLAARAALTAVNEDLRVGLHMPVVTCIGPLEPPYQLERLVAAWRFVARDQPHARLWLIGDGTMRERLHRNIQDADLVGRVLMPGTFDDLDDALHASDLLVLPSGTVDQSLTILRAMAARLPVLAADGPTPNHLLWDGRGRTLTHNDAHALAAAITAALADPQRGDQMAGAASDFVRQHHSLQEMARQHHQLFQDLVRASQRLAP